MNEMTNIKLLIVTEQNALKSKRWSGLFKLNKLIWIPDSIKSLSLRNFQMLNFKRRKSMNPIIDIKIYTNSCTSYCSAT